MCLFRAAVIGCTSQWFLKNRSFFVGKSEIRAQASGEGSCQLPRWWLPREVRNFSLIGQKEEDTEGHIIPFPRLNCFLKAIPPNTVPWDQTQSEHAAGAHPYCLPSPHSDSVSKEEAVCHLCLMGCELWRASLRSKHFSIFICDQHDHTCSPPQMIGNRVLVTYTEHWLMARGAAVGTQGKIQVHPLFYNNWLSLSLF